MNPDYYANEYRRYQSFVRDYNNEHHIQKICCGAPHEDYEWTKEVMATCFRRTYEEQHGFMDGLSLHYYVYPEGIEIMNVERGIHVSRVQIRDFFISRIRCVMHL